MNGSLTPEQVAHKLQVDVRTVYRWLRSGELPAIKLGRTWRVPERVFEELPGRQQVSKSRRRGETR